MKNNRSKATKMTRILTILLASVLIATALPIQAFAQDSSVTPQTDRLCTIHYRLHPDSDPEAAANVEFYYPDEVYNIDAYDPADPDTDPEGCYIWIEEGYELYGWAAADSPYWFISSAFFFRVPRPTEAGEVTYYALVKKNEEDFHADNSGINWYRVNDPVMGTVTVEREDRGTDLYALPKGSTAIPNPGYRFKYWGHYVADPGSDFRDPSFHLVIDTTSATWVPAEYNHWMDYYAVFEVDPLTQLKVTRLFGQDRYQTSGATHGYLPSLTSAPAQVSTIVLVSGEDKNYPDGPMASTLAHIESASLLVTPTNSLSAAAKDAIAAPAVNKVLIIGSDQTISDKVFQQVRAIKPGLSLSRVAGTDRHKTAEAAYSVYSQGSWGNTAIVISGNSFADALSIAAFAAANHYPIFYSTQSGLTTRSTELLHEGNFQRILIIGDTKAVSAKTAAQAQSASGLTKDKVVRLGGANRYQTSQNVFDWVTSNERDVSERLSADGLALTRGDKHVDALSACILQAYSSSPLLLVAPVPVLDTETRNLLTKQAASINEIRFLGSAAALPEPLIKEAINTVNAARKLTFVWAPDNSVAVGL